MGGLPPLRKHIGAAAGAVGAVRGREARVICPVRAVRPVGHHLSKFSGNMVHRGGIIRMVDA